MLLVNLAARWRVAGEQGEVLCGVGYKQGSPGCTECSRGYYPVMRSCQQCPAHGVKPFTSAIVAVVVVVMAASVLYIGWSSMMGAWSLVVDCAMSSSTVHTVFLAVSLTPSPQRCRRCLRYRPFKFSAPCALCLPEAVFDALSSLSFLPTPH